MKTGQFFSFLLILLLALTACQKDRSNLSISGEILEADKQIIYLKKLGKEKDKILDSTLIKKNTFDLKGKIDRPSFLSLELKKGKGITLIAHPGENITVKSKAPKISQSYNIKGSPESEIIMRLNHKMEDYYKKVDSLGKVYRDLQDSVHLSKLRTRLDSIYEKYYNKTKNDVLNYIDNNKDKLAGLIALYQQKDPREFMIKWEKNLPLLQTMDSLLTEKYPKHESVKLFHQQLQEVIAEHQFEQKKQLTLSPGHEAPEIELPDTSGNYISLSGLRGDYVLLDFWASWCHPCRENNEKLINIYRKFNSEGFEIYQVSLDKKKKSWIRAIRNDQLNWQHVSDLKMWESIVVPLYDIKNIPANYLLDPQGAIIEKNLYGEQLEEELKGLLE